MQSSLVSLSNELASLVEKFQSDVVAVHARAHYPSSGVHWRPGIMVTADHTIREEEDIQVTLSSGETAKAALVGPRLRNRRRSPEGGRTRFSRCPTR